MTFLTHHGAAPKACFHTDPSVCVQTNTVHSTHDMNTPHCMGRGEREGGRGGMEREMGGGEGKEEGK